MGALPFCIWVEVLQAKGDGMEERMTKTPGGTGAQQAPPASTASMELRAMAVEFPVVHGHPNRLPFEGVLTLVDVASDKAPNGARGHRVILTRSAAEAALPSLLGMAVDYKAGWDGHDARQKCGIITSAEVDGNRLRVAGYLFARDFPEMEEKIHASGPHGHELRAGRRACRRYARFDLDADARNLYRGSDSAARQSRLSQHQLPRTAARSAVPAPAYPPSR